MASVDHGASIGLFPSEPLISLAYPLGQPNVGTQGVYEEPYTITTPSHGRDRGPTFTVISGIDGAGIPTKITYYKMQGWYVAGTAYETWTSSNAPILTPPSGHSLSDVAVVGMTIT